MKGRAGRKARASTDPNDGSPASLSTNQKENVYPNAGANQAALSSQQQEYNAQHAALLADFDNSGMFLFVSVDQVMFVHATCSSLL